MLEDDIIDVFDRERYVHRVAIDGEPLHYVAIAARKRSAIPADLLDEADDVDDRR